MYGMYYFADRENIDESQSEVVDGNKGTCQKRFSGFFPLRGGVPPLSAKLF